MRTYVYCVLAAAMLSAWGATTGATKSARLELAAEPQATTQAQIVRALGSIKSIEGNTIGLSQDSGPDVTIQVKQGARMLRVEPGETDLKHAVPLQLSELQKDDRIRVRGTMSPDGKTMLGLEVIAIKHWGIQARQQKEHADWQTRGIGGLVKEVDSGAGTITVTTGVLAGAKLVTIHTSRQTILRRYAPDSVKFDDAKPAALNQVQPGDQLRARGTRSADGAELAAEEVVSGTFRNIAGTITSVDADSKTLVVNDLLSKQPVTIRISGQSQIRKLAPEMAQGIAARLKAAAAGTTSRAPAGTPSAGGGGGIGPGGSGPGAGTPAPGRDFQQMVNRLPQVALADLQKGEAVILVASAGSSSTEVTAITLLGGVEPILTASPRGAQGFTLSPWTISSGGEAGDSNP